MLSQSANPWRSALQVKAFRNKFIITVALLAIYAWVAPFLFQFIQERKGLFLNDFLLNKLPSYDLSFWIFLILYITILSGTYLLARDPSRFLTVLVAYLLLTIFRSITMVLIPLEPPANIIELRDPMVQYLFYQQSVTKDLFFSGHTSILVLLALAMKSSVLRIVFFTSALAVALMLLIQHAHYTIDIVFAPLFAWLSMALVKKNQKTA